MKRSAATGRHVAANNGSGIRPAADLRQGSGKASRTAKKRASRARDEMAAFKSAHR